MFTASEDASGVLEEGTPLFEVEIAPEELLALSTEEAISNEEA